MLLTIIYFFIIALGFSFFVDLFIKWDADIIEQLALRLGIGIVLIPITGVILNLFYIPIHWIIFLIIALILPLIAFIKKKTTFFAQVSMNHFQANKITKKQIYYVLLLIMFGVTSYMYIHGSFTPDPYAGGAMFEDSDPYTYANAAKYIAMHKTFSAPYHFGHMAEPYAQGYQIFLGLLLQTTSATFWTMKFFHALIISLSILFFFFFVKRFSNNSDVAIIATFALFAIPCWVSHFIFSLNFNMALFPVFLYCLVMIEQDKNWKYPLMFSFASILVNHAYTGLTITIFFIIYYIIKIVVDEKLHEDLFHAAFFGFLLSLLFYVPSYLRHPDMIGNAEGLGGIEFLIKAMLQMKDHPVMIVSFIIVLGLAIALYIFREKWFILIKKVLHIKNIRPIGFIIILAVILAVLIIPDEKFVNIRGSGTKGYVAGDFFFAQNGNLTNNPIGVGFVLMWIFVIGMMIIVFNYKHLFNKNNFWVCVTFIWSIAALLFIFGWYFSIMYVPFRMWQFFAVFASIIIGFGLYNILSLIKNNFIKILMLILIILFVMMPIKIPFMNLAAPNMEFVTSSFPQKYWHNMAWWSEHMIMVPESQKLYLWMREGGIPKDSKVLPLCNYPTMITGYDMDSQQWKDPLLGEYAYKGVEPFYRTSLNQTLDENYQVLKKFGYEYTILGASCYAKFKVNDTLLSNRIQEMASSPKFTVVRSTQSEVLFRVN